MKEGGGNLKEEEDEYLYEVEETFAAITCIPGTLILLFLSAHFEVGSEIISVQYIVVL